MLCLETNPSTQRLPYKDKVRASFSASASTYDGVAKVQQHAAILLGQLMLKNRQNLVPGSVLEIGAGTGFLTSEVVSIFHDRPITVSDISSEMLDACQERLRHHACRQPALKFEILDAESLFRPECHAVVASSFAFQWFSDFSSGLTNLCRSLKPGGSLFFCLPGLKSFHRWQELCQQLQVPFTGNALPSSQTIREIASIEGMELKLEESIFLEHFPSMSSLLKTLKSLGASTQRDDILLGPGQLRRFMRQADILNPEGISICYQILYGQMIRRSSKQ